MENTITVRHGKVLSAASHPLSILESSTCFFGEIEKKTETNSFHPRGFGNFSNERREREKASSHLTVVESHMHACCLKITLNKRFT